MTELDSEVVLCNLEEAVAQSYNPPDDDLLIEMFATPFKLERSHRGRSTS